MSRIRLLTAVAIVLTVSNNPVYAADDPWFFSANEIASAYKYQQQFGARLRHPLKPEVCFYGEKEFIATFKGEEFSAPCRFITESIRHLREMLESGAAKYLFPLDIDQAHLAVPSELWQTKYRKLPVNEMLPALLREPSLVAIYHTGQHAAQPSAQGPGEQISRGRHSVVGFYDGRPIQILPARRDGSESHKPSGYEWASGFTFLTHSLGELSFILDGKVVTFDISFDDDRAGDSPPGGGSAGTRSSLLQGVRLEGVAAQ